MGDPWEGGEQGRFFIRGGGLRNPPLFRWDTGFCRVHGRKAPLDHGSIWSVN